MQILTRNDNERAKMTVYLDIHLYRILKLITQIRMVYTIVYAATIRLSTSLATF